MLRWNIIDQLKEYQGRMTWKGQHVADVGKRYRRLDTEEKRNCSLCQQLHAAWIEEFIDDQYKYHHDFGDRIQIFRHLRHLPHVNDFQQARDVLRNHNTPFHIAVVPKFVGWRSSLEKHIAKNGMVVIIPEGQPESQVFAPQQISPRFDPRVVKSWTKQCRHHKYLCNTRVPKVPGLKLINCDSEDLRIQYWRPGDEYVALSYVWGNDEGMFERPSNSTPTLRESSQLRSSRQRSPSLFVRTPANSRPASISRAASVLETSAARQGERQPARPFGVSHGFVPTSNVGGTTSAAGRATSTIPNTRTARATPTIRRARSAIPNTNTARATSKIIRAQSHASATSMEMNVSSQRRSQSAVSIGSFRAVREYLGRPESVAPGGPVQSATSVSRASTASQYLPHVPQVVRDAIAVTKSLGCRFLWVDQYCINQASETEKQQQFGHMGDIYAAAELTIFSLGRNANQGLPGVNHDFVQWEQRCTTVRGFKFISTKPDPHFCIAASTWSSRAWTYQEGLFSTRRLFFTDYQLYFECNAMNTIESMKSNPRVLHTNDGQRYRAYHRAGRFIIGNSNSYSHVRVTQSRTNHRKIDIIRRCQQQIREYTKRELTNEHDILNAFAGIARYYAISTAKIASLAGIPVPFPIACLNPIEKEGLDHLSYALGWTHQTGVFDQFNFWVDKKLKQKSYYVNMDGMDTPMAGRREGFPSWSWAGWFGEIGERRDYPYCWTSELNTVHIEFRDGSQRDLGWLTQLPSYPPEVMHTLFQAQTLRFYTRVVDPHRIKFWDKDDQGVPHPSRNVHVHLSTGPGSYKYFEQYLKNGDLECLVLGTHGAPRGNVYRAIQSADKKSSRAKKRRIDKFERKDPEAMICLVVQTENGVSRRVGLLKLDYWEIGRQAALDTWLYRGERLFTLA
ncbi:hypothetical protein S40288_06889 [Stachybotrys chartarum IBT 40288]|nr:hypothetical protein S40288_06889 [Stachybotrys chartarum IBT 40288]